MYNPDFLKNGRERTADSRFVVQNEDNGTIAGNFIDNGRLRNFLIPDEKRMVHSARFELTTYCSGGNRSIQLSYECGKIQYYTALLTFRNPVFCFFLNFFAFEREERDGTAGFQRSRHRKTDYFRLSIASSNLILDGTKSIRLTNSQAS